MISVFYTPKMVAFGDDFSPSARKPKDVVQSWTNKKWPIQIIEPMPANVRQLAMAHDIEYVRDVLMCKTENGFGNCRQDVADSLPYTNGAMLDAARLAVRCKSVAVAPCAGFHHATYNYAAGYCTFNGLMVAALVLKSEGLVKRVGILDCDQHFGDGTENIIRRTKSSEWVRHFTNTRGYVADAKRFFEALPKMLDELNDCDLVIYQAGADPHINDPLGGFLTTEQLKLRDAMVFDAVKNLGIPLVWDLAGGYQKKKWADGTESIEPVIEIHDNTMRECIRAYIGAAVAN